MYYGSCVPGVYEQEMVWVKVVVCSSLACCNSWKIEEKIDSKTPPIFQKIEGVFESIIDQDGQTDQNRFKNRKKIGLTERVLVLYHK